MFGSEEFIKRCKQEIADYYNSHRDVTDSQELKEQKMSMLCGTASRSKITRDFSALLSQMVSITK